MSGKGDKRRPGANDALYLKNNPFPSLLERRKEREARASHPVPPRRSEIKSK